MSRKKLYIQRCLAIVLTFALSIGTVVIAHGAGAEVVLNKIKNKITKTSVVLYGTIENPGKERITDIGIYIYDADTGEIMADHTEPVNSSYRTAASVPMWFATETELPDNLQPGTQYDYVMFAYIGGVYYDAASSFQTSGKKPAAPSSAPSSKAGPAKTDVVLNISKNKIGKTSVTL